MLREQRRRADRKRHRRDLDEGKIEPGLIYGLENQRTW
jgi:hypothetical protein